MPETRNGDVERRKTYLGRGTAHSGMTGSTKGGCHSQPAIANPGTAIEAIWSEADETFWLDINVGGGAMGSRIAHENEAPYPERLAEFFIRSLCPPGGIVLDPFGGSGTTAAVAKAHGRNAISSDLRQSQCELMRRRLQGVQPPLFLEEAV